MKRHLLVPVIALLLGLLLAGPVAAQQQQDQPQMTEEEKQKMREMMEKMQGNQMMPQQIEPGMYTSDRFGYSMEVPEGWNGQVIDRVLIAVLGDMQELREGMPARAITIFAKAEEDMDEKFTGKELGEIDIEKFREEAEKSLREQSQAAEVEIEKIEHTQLAGEDAVHVIERMKMNDERQGYEGWLKVEMFVVRHGDNYLHVMYTAPEDQWDEAEEFIDNHLETFTLN